MKYIGSIVFACFFAFSPGWSQGTLKGTLNLTQDPNEQIIFSVAGKQEVSLEEFKRQFLKNLNLKEQNITGEDIDNYLRLYVRFKLKIQDALDAGRDTVQVYQRELAMYREQLARNYLYDRNVTDKLIEEAYDRLKEEVNVSHILIRCERNASPDKVTAILKRMTEIKNQLNRDPSAKNFSDLASTDSEDPGSKSSGGALGYLTAMQVVYEFENAAYQTPVGGISEIFRTDFGFHILRVNDKRSSLGEAKAKHILIRTGNNAAQSSEDAEKLAKEIFAKIKGGESFEEMAKKHSEDFSSKYNGGNMNSLSVTQYIGDIERQNWAEKVFKLSKEGEITEPFRTTYGWHILQLVERRSLKPFGEMKVSLRNKVQQNQRSQIGIDSLVVKIKREDGFQENTALKDVLFAILEKDTSLKSGKFDLLGVPEELSYVENKKNIKVKLFDAGLFTLAKEIFTVEQFLGRLAAQKTAVEGNVASYIEENYSNWVREACVSYQNEHLEEKSSEFKYIFKEYKEGILMFNRMQEMVWDRANKDSLGLVDFFEGRKSEYRWEDRFHSVFLFCSDKKMMNAAAKQLKKGIELDSIRKTHTAKSQLDFSYRLGKYQLSDSFLFLQKDPLKRIFSEPKFRKKKNQIFKLGQMGEDWVVVKILEFIPAGPKNLEETRGPVASKYQELLEQQWLEELEKRYSVEVNTALLNLFKQEINAK